MPTHPEDLALAKRIVAGDEDAAHEFERKYRRRFEFLARKAGVPYQDCPDVAQETFLMIFRQLNSFRGDSLLGTWMRPILNGRIADYWRNRRRQPPDSDVPESLLLAPASNEDDVFAVREALARMPEDLRTILVLNRSEKVTLEDISRTTGMTLGQVSNRLYKAIRVFSELIKRGDYGRKLIAKRASSAEETEDD